MSRRDDASAGATHTAKMVAPVSAVPTAARKEAKSSRPTPTCDGARLAGAGARSAHTSGSTSTVSVPATASTRIRSPLRISAMAPPSAASGVTWIAAGTLPEAPESRPSVTSATLLPRSCSTPSGGISLCSSGMPLAFGPWKRTTATKSPLRSPALKAA